MGIKITKENLENFLPSLKIAASNLKGSARRMFLGQLALDYGRGGRSNISKQLEISRGTLNKGIQEVITGIIKQDKFSERGRKRLEELQPNLIKDIKEIGNNSSQTDPQFKSTRLYTRLSVNQVRKELIKRGYTDAELPSNETLRNKLIILGFKRKKVAKTKPKKKIKETDAIFNQLEKENKAATLEKGVLRLSHDAKNKVKIGNFSRGGKNWSALKALDHDFGKEYITPFGFYLPELKDTHLYFTSSKVTADFIVDCLCDYWENNRIHFTDVHTLLLNGDNGPECHSRRTQFIKRICEFSVKYNIIVKLAYYPPYHSKYNPIERVWGGLEQHWNGDILDTQETVIKFALNFVWAEKNVHVKVCNKIYETGKKLTTKAMALHELAIDRLNLTIGKWFVTINPEKVKAILKNTV